MPITGDATKVKKNMEKTYGKKEGEKVFYATANKQGRKPETWKKKASQWQPPVIGAGVGVGLGAATGGAVGVLRALLSKKVRRREGFGGAARRGAVTGALIGGSGGLGVGVGANLGSNAAHKAWVNALGLNK